MGDRGLLASFAAKWTVWLARPGLPILTELFEDAAAAADGEGAPVVSGVALPLPAGRAHLLTSLGIPGLEAATDSRVSIMLGSERVDPCALE